VILDGGTGIRRLGGTIGPEAGRVDLLLTHLHMDHIQGLGFFRPLDEPGQDVHIWGPPSTTLDLRTRLGRYFSPPLFPVRLRELPCRLSLHDVPLESFHIGRLTISSGLVCHPGATVGYRISDGSATVTYTPDHEVALGVSEFPDPAEWTSGFDLAVGADLLIHDAQFTLGEYSQRVGWGHSALSHTVRFAAMAGVKRLVTFHHDPSHSDAMLDRLLAEARGAGALPFELLPGIEGAVFEI
jgi:ribonuclease BN (tRNA processing enzyme)